MKGTPDSACDGGWKNERGENIYPYKSDERPIHNPMDYSSADVNRDVC